MSHAYEPEACLDCDELILLHRNGSGHSRCAICGANDPDECRDPRPAAGLVRMGDIQRARHEIIREVRSQVTAGLVGTTLQKHFDEFKDEKRTRMHDYGVVVVKAIGDILDEIELEFEGEEQ